MEFCREAAVGLENILVRLLSSDACVDNARVVILVCVFVFAGECCPSDLCLRYAP